MFLLIVRFHHLMCHADCCPCIEAFISTRSAIRCLCRCEINLTLSASPSLHNTARRYRFPLEHSPLTVRLSVTTFALRRYPPPELVVLGMPGGIENKMEYRSQGVIERLINARRETS